MLSRLNEPINAPDNNDITIQPVITSENCFICFNMLNFFVNTTRYSRKTGISIMTLPFILYPAIRRNPEEISSVAERTFFFHSIPLRKRRIEPRVNGILTESV